MSKARKAATGAPKKGAKKGAKKRAKKRAKKAVDPWTSGMFVTACTPESAKDKRTGRQLATEALEYLGPMRIGAFVVDTAAAIATARISSRGLSRNGFARVNTVVALLPRRARPFVRRWAAATWLEEQRRLIAMLPAATWEDRCQAIREALPAIESSDEAKIAHQHLDAIRWGLGTIDWEKRLRDLDHKIARSEGAGGGAPQGMLSKIIEAAFSGWSGDNAALRMRLDRCDAEPWNLPAGVRDIAPMAEGLLVIRTNRNRQTHTWDAVDAAAAKIRSAPQPGVVRRRG